MLFLSPYKVLVGWESNVRAPEFGIWKLKPKPHATDSLPNGSLGIEDLLNALASKLHVNCNWETGTPKISGDPKPGTKGPLT